MDYMPGWVGWTVLEMIFALVPCSGSCDLNAPLFSRIRWVAVFNANQQIS